MEKLQMFNTAEISKVVGEKTEIITRELINKSVVGYKLHFSPFPADEFEGVASRPTVYASDVSLEIIDTLGLDFLRNNPAERLKQMATKKIGWGMQSEVHEIKLTGKDLVLKTINQEAQTHLEDELVRKIFGRAIFRPPDYLNKFGVTEEMARILKILEGEYPFKTFTLSESPKDILAGQN